MRRSLVFAVAILASAAAPVAAQQARSISSGMSEDEVRTAFGTPSVVRQAEGWTYYFYTNRCLPRCGTDDTVFFRDGQVVAAVLHAPSRRFSGPPAAQAISEVDPAPSTRSGNAAPAAVSGLRVRTADGEERAVDLGSIRGRPQPVASGAAAGDDDDDDLPPQQVAPAPAQPNVGTEPAPMAPAPVEPAAPAAPANLREAQQLREQGISPNAVRQRQ